jgi:hypothetical protein
MKNPPPSGHSLLLYGPLFIGEIHTDEISFLTNKNNNGRNPFKSVKLLVDTGSNISGLDHSVVKMLSLPKYKTPAEVDGVGGKHALDMHSCILFLDIFGLKGLPLDFLAGDYSNSPYDGILGRDVLQFCKFTFDGPSNMFVLEAINF